MGVRAACFLAVMISVGGLPPSCKKLAKVGDQASPDQTQPLPTMTIPTALPTNPTALGTATTAVPNPPASGGSNQLAGDSLLSLGTGEWLTYQPEGPRFSVLLPQRAQESSTQIKFNGGAWPARQAFASRVGALYTLLWCDLPAGYKGDVKLALDVTRDDAIHNAWNATLRFEREIKLGKNPGREFQAEQVAPFGMTILGHAYLVGRRLYEQIIAVPSTSAEGSYVDKFMTSLAVANEGTGASAVNDDPSTNAMTALSQPDHFAVPPDPNAVPNAAPSASASGKPPKKKR